MSVVSFHMAEMLSILTAMSKRLPLKFVVASFIRYAVCIGGEERAIRHRA